MELAGQLATSENAVRSHLAALEAEGYVRMSGKRAGTRKPHFSYELTPKAHDLFANAYEPVLVELLEVLALTCSDQKLTALALDVGRRFVHTLLSSLKRHKTASRLKTVISKSCDAGIPLNVVQHNGEIIIRGCSCPLTSVVKRRPALCDVVARLLAEVLEQPVTQQCDHGVVPRCEFRTERPSGFRLTNTGSANG